MINTKNTRTYCKGKTALETLSTGTFREAYLKLKDGMNRLII